MCQISFSVNKHFSRNGIWQKKSVKIVCAKHKTLLSRWEASSIYEGGGGNLHTLSTMYSFQSTSKDEKDLKSQVAAPEEELWENEEKVKQGDENYEKMLQFKISKFPNSQKCYAHLIKKDCVDTMTWYLSDQDSRVIVMTFH